MTPDERKDRMNRLMQLAISHQANPNADAWLVQAREILPADVAEELDSDWESIEYFARVSSRHADPDDLYALMLLTTVESWLGRENTKLRQTVAYYHTDSYARDLDSLVGEYAKGTQEQRRQLVEQITRQVLKTISFAELRGAETVGLVEALWTVYQEVGRQCGRGTEWETYLGKAILDVASRYDPSRRGYPRILELAGDITGDFRKRGLAAFIPKLADPPP